VSYGSEQIRQIFPWLLDIDVFPDSPGVMALNPVPISVQEVGGNGFQEFMDFHCSPI
jgi:hypothetical protein